MNQNTAFVISEFTNPSGEIVFRVAGWLDGKRVRKNFPTRAEANAERQTLDVQRLQSETGIRTAATRLTDEQLKDAEAAFRRLADAGHSLLFCVDFTAANYRPPEKQRALADAVADYVTAKEHEFEQGQLSVPQIKRIRSDLKRLKTHYAGKSVAEITPASLVAFFEMGRPGLKTYNNRRGIVSTFYKFSFHRGWIAENPVLKVPHHRIRRRRGAAKTMTADEARKIMAHLETFEGGRWVPYFALCLFAGIRPGVPDGEMSKLPSEAVNLNGGFIAISAEVSKIREPRKITIQPNLAAWLRAYPLEKFPLVVGNFQQRCSALRKKFNLSHDVMRHTFISMFVAKFRSIGEAAIQAGNSESIIRRHYLDMKTAEEAEEYFGILPKRSAAFEPISTAASRPVDVAA
ncbi:MAG: site-specific integrase [Verrucomicrobia bacterium]|nr:site-specific integrase [Verrucomicrobiota bacterium]